METKTNGQRWRSYVTRDVDRKKIEAYLENPTSVEHYLDLHYLQIPLRPLVHDTDYSKAPTAEWYVVHTCVQDEKKWNQRLIAWGLNRTRNDMYKLQKRMLDKIMKTRDMAVLPPNHLAAIFRRLYQSLAPRFVNAFVPWHWYHYAQDVFLAKCRESAESMLRRGFYDKKSCQWTKAGMDNWNDLYTSSDSLEELVRPSFALVKENADMPPQEALPSLQCLPSELLTRILDYALDPPVLGEESNVEKTSTWLQAHALDWSRRQTVTIRTCHWPPERFPTDKLPVEWLQSLKKVQFDFDGVAYSSRQRVHPVMEQLAEIWKEKNELQSLVLPVAPDITYLLQQEPRVEFDPVQKGVYAPLLTIPGIEPEYTIDFGAPVSSCGYTTLCELVRPRNQVFESSLRIVLGTDQSLINMTCREDKLTPLHVAVSCTSTRNVELLLETPGIDVNTQDINGDTPFDYATAGGTVETAVLLTRHKGFKATEDNFVNMVNRMRNRRLILALYDAYGGVPAHVAKIPGIRQVLRDAGRLR